MTPHSEDRPAAVVTGATAGLGFFTAAGLARRGHLVVVTGRDHERGQTAEAELRRRSGGEVRFVRADHATVGGNLQLGAALTRRLRSLDLLVNNVGGIYADRWETADGDEGTLAINFVGPFALTQQLLPLLRRAGGRCVNVVSSAFTMVKGDPFADLHSQRGYVGIKAYARAKLLNVMWMRALADREPTLGVYAANPGMAWTPSTQALTPKAVPAWRLVWRLVRFIQRRASAEQAAQTPIRVACGDIAAPSGTYVNDQGQPEQLPERFLDAHDLERVWALGETLLAHASTATPFADHHGGGGR
jgi:NAD(P)-dependent dehydrogenase (short-subunit alcohol dehydrogenase family)